MKKQYHLLITTVRKKVRKFKNEMLFRWLFKLSKQSIIYNPSLDLAIVPSSFDLRKSTSAKVSNLILEIGTGNGQFLTYIALKKPKSLVLGFEVAKPYFLKTKNAIMREMRMNAKAVHGEAFELIDNHIADSSVSEIYINFPDPWPKKGHWKRRIINPTKLPVLLSKLKPNGFISFSTDNMGYADYVEETTFAFKGNHKLKIESVNSIPEDYPVTKYNKKWIDQGKKEYRTIKISKQ